MIILGIEGTAHTLGFAIMKNKQILADTKDMFTTKQGGMIPSEVANHHKKLKDKLLNKVLKDAKLDIEEIDLIAFSQGPGLAPTLLVVKDIALELSNRYNIPLVGVNHICAHLEIGKLLTKAKDPIFVFVSGANTQIISHEGNKYRVFGECLSIALGNALDKFARGVKLGFPGGPKIEKLAKKGKFVELPYKVKGMDVDFSGLVTKALQLYNKGEKIEDLCFSLQETMFSMLTEVTERALAYCDKKEVLLIGGVAANQRLCAMLTLMTKSRKAKFFAAPLKYVGDNATMIAWLGYLMYKTKPKQNDFDIKPRQRIDQIKTYWI